MGVGSRVLLESWKRAYWIRRQAGLNRKTYRQSLALVGVPIHNPLRTFLRAYLRESWTHHEGTANRAVSLGLYIDFPARRVNRQHHSEAGVVPEGFGSIQGPTPYSSEPSL